MDVNRVLKQNETKITSLTIRDFFSDPSPWLQITKCSSISRQHQYFSHAEPQLSPHTKWNIKKTPNTYTLFLQLINAMYRALSAAAWDGNIEVIHNL